PPDDQRLIDRVAAETEPTGFAPAFLRAKDLAWAAELIDKAVSPTWPGTVKIGTRVERVGRSSIVLAQALFLKARYVARAKSLVVLIDAATRRAIQLPPFLINALYVIGKNGLHNRFGANFRLGNAIKGIRVQL